MKGKVFVKISAPRLKIKITSEFFNPEFNCEFMDLGAETCFLREKRCSDRSIQLEKEYTLARVFSSGFFGL